MGLLTSVEMAVKVFSQISLARQFKGLVAVERKAQQELEVLLVEDQRGLLVKKEVPAHQLLVVVAEAAQIVKTGAQAAQA